MNTRHVEGMRSPHDGHGQTPPGEWRVVPGEPPGTLGWWNGYDFIAFATWATDHWVYVTDTWSGPDPPPGLLPDGAGDPKESGWLRSSDGLWYRPTPRPPSSMRAARQERGYWSGVAAVGVMVVDWFGWIAFLIGQGSYVFIPFIVLGPWVSAILGAVAMGAPRGSPVRRLGLVALVMAIVGFVVLGLAFVLALYFVLSFPKGL
jgi:hypothetical protein